MANIVDFIFDNKKNHNPHIKKKTVHKTVIKSERNANRDKKKNENTFDRKTH